jgi:hypothetical protein
MKVTVFWDIVACSLVAFDRRFGNACCLHYLGVEQAAQLQLKHYTVVSLFNPLVG